VAGVLDLFWLLATIAGLTPQSLDLNARLRGTIYNLGFVSLEAGAIWLMWRNLRTRRSQIALMREVVKLRMIGKRRRPDVLEGEPGQQLGSRELQELQ
jgi:hypothetical protein